VKLKNSIGNNWHHSTNCKYHFYKFVGIENFLVLFIHKNNYLLNLKITNRATLSTKERPQIKEKENKNPI